jgi:hypothetical protein
MFRLVRQVRSFFVYHKIKKMLHNGPLCITGVTQRVSYSHETVIVVSRNFPCLTRDQGRIYPLFVSVIAISQENRKIVGLFPFPSRVTMRMSPSISSRRIRWALRSGMPDSAMKSALLKIGREAVKITILIRVAFF